MTVVSGSTRNDPTVKRSPRDVDPVPRTAARQPRPAAGSGTVLELVDRARESLLQACHATVTVDRYAAAQLGALRAATALLASRPASGRRSGPRAVWTVLADGTPELREWSEFFALTSVRGALAARDRAHPTTREADDLVRQAEMFLELILARLGLPMQTALPECVSPLRRS